MLDQLKQLYELNKKTQQLKAELEKIEVEAVSREGIKVIITGAQKIKSISVPDSLSSDKAKLENCLAEAFNNAIKQSQELAAKKMKEITGINIPGL